MIVVHVWIKVPGEKLYRFIHHGASLGRIRLELDQLAPTLPDGSKMKARLPRRREMQRN